jgi:hypothetical protein
MSFLDNFKKKQTMAKTDTKEETPVPFDVDTLHNEAMKRLQKVETDKKRRPEENHLQPFYEVDVKKSYAASLKLCNGDKLKIAHLQSVLAAGSGTYDR